MPIDPSEYRRVLGHFPTGVTVVTGADDEGAVGMTIGSFASVSLDPPLVMFCPTHGSTTWQRIKEAGTFCVNVLGDDQLDLCGLFAGKDEDKFAEIEWTTEHTGAPVLPGSIAWIDCDIHAVHDGGDHAIVVGLVKALRTVDELGSRGPLLFFQGGFGQFGTL